MARPSLVLDASIGVKWFSAKGEDALSMALAIRDAHIARELTITVPDLFFYEVASAIAHKKFIPTRSAQSAIRDLLDLHLDVVAINARLLDESVKLSRDLNITVYDACYISAACNLGCPLVTANPGHQGRSTSCKIIPIEKWKPA
jgi:predicted nucleic acid-binding protein